MTETIDYEEVSTPKRRAKKEKKVSNSKKVTTVEIVEEVEESIDIVMLENNFNSFKKNNTIKTLEITKTISMMELDTIKDLIIDAKLKIEDYASGKNVSMMTRAKQRVAALPLIGGFAKKSLESAQRASAENSSINEVFKGLFNNFTTKQDRILELVEMLDSMKHKIEEQTDYISEIIESTDYIISTEKNMAQVFRAKRLNEMARTTLLKNQDKVANKINPGLMLAAKSLENMNKILPSLESDMLDELGINGALNSFKDVNVMLKETMELANNITSISAKNTEELMLEVMEISDTSNNIKYIEEAQNRRLGFQAKFEKVMTDSLTRQEQNYTKIKELSENYSTNSTLSAMIESYSNGTHHSLPNNSSKPQLKKINKG